MNAALSIQQRRRDILAELAILERIRRGSVTEQYVEATGRRGRQTRRGPYPLYSFKTGGRTVSRRLQSGDAAVYREQIAAGRRFQQLTRELMELGEALCDQDLQAEAEKKTPSA
jgi:cell division protein YceG involved in septum cleavage